MTDVLRWGSALAPERRALTKLRVARVADFLGERRALLLGGAAAVGVVALGFGAAYVNHEQVVAAQAAAVRETRANTALQQTLAELRDEAGATSQALRRAQGQIAALSRQVKQQNAASRQAANSTTGQIAQLAQALDQAERELHLTEAQRATLLARLGMAEATAAHQRQKAETLSADRGRAAQQRDALRARLNARRQKLSQIPQPAEQPLATAQPSRRGARPAHERQVALIMPGRAPLIAAERPAEPANAAREPAATGRLADVERVLASTGVDVKRLFSDFGNESGLGGPFVPMSRDALAANRVSAVKLAALPGLLKSLPTSAPMYNYRETSPFGERTDPFNGRSAFHPGIDLAAPYGTPVYATAAGVVTFSGWSGGYGRIVEINHGHGIVTRYGHLARSIVLVGEHVNKGAQIGYEGSTGRSTGPHVIYEIDVNGEPQDPAKFMSLARVLPAAR